MITGQGVGVVVVSCVGQGGQVEVVWLVHPAVGQVGQVGAGGHVDWVAVV